ncbi:MAG: 50S ribosomal protein L19 [Candidatus Paceibacterota bacterium]
MGTITPEQIKPGMYLRVYQKVKEGEKTRIQRIEGLVLARKHGSEPGATFTLRRIIDGVEVEWILPVFSPTIDKIELIQETRPRRAKLYYIREKSQKEAKKKLKALKESPKETQEEETQEEIREELKEEETRAA